MAGFADRHLWRGWDLWLRRVALLCVTLLIGIVFVTYVFNTNQGDTLSLETQAVALDKSLICPVCPGESIDQSQADLAKQMRALVRKKLGENETPDEIKQYFVERYGPMVLAEPPKSGFNLVVWVVPPLMLLIGGIVLCLVIRGLKQGKGWLVEDTELVEKELEPYLSLVDEQIPEASIEPSNPAPSAKTKKTGPGNRVPEGQGS